MKPSLVLIQAIREHDSEKVRDLLKAGADPNATTIAPSTWQRALWRAQARMGPRFGTMGAAMAIGAAFKLAQPDPVPAVVLATWENMPEADAIAIIETLLDHGADVNRPNHLGNTALLNAANQGKLKIIDTLLVRGADVNRKNNSGLTPLIVAFRSPRRGDAVRRILESHPDLDSQYDFGDSALMVACADPSYYPLAKLLIEAGANPHLTNTLGKNALAIAREHQCEKTIELLLSLKPEYGGRV